MSPTPRPETTGGLLRPDSLYASRYRIEQQIGRGGVGVVYEAHDESLNRPVAVKVVRAADDDDHRYAERFAREAQMQARIRSRHTVTIHEHGEVEGTVFLVTDLMPDGDLHSWLMREGPMPWRAALSVTAQVCEALEDTHRAGIAHRDVKPSNVLLWARTDGLIAFLCDFGIAAAIGDDTQRELTEVGAVVGSPAYMPPERLMGTGGDDERGDVYSAGCVLWSTLTGEAPYSGTDLDVMTQHVQGPVPQLATGDPVDDKIDALLRKVLAKDPADRLASAEEFRHELRKIHAAVAGAPPMSGLHPVPPSVAAAQPTVAVLPVARASAARAGRATRAGGRPAGGLRRLLHRDRTRKGRDQGPGGRARHRQAAWSSLEAAFHLVRRSRGRGRDRRLDGSPGHRSCPTHRSRRRRRTRRAGVRPCFGGLLAARERGLRGQHPR